MAPQGAIFVTDPRVLCLRLTQKDVAMQTKPLLEPKVVIITGLDGKDRSFMISKFPAIAGRRIIAKYPLSALPKLGDYAENEKTMMELMQYVEVIPDGDNAQPIRLLTEEVINNHVGDWETLIKVESQMLQYNTSFFTGGFLQGFTEMLLEKAAPIVSKILTNSLQALSGQVSQLGSNSETK